MSTAELKIDIINIIANMTDVAKLTELMELPQFQKEESVFMTTHDDKQAIAEAFSQIGEGEVLTNETVAQEISEWLNK